MGEADFSNIDKIETWMKENEELRHKIRDDNEALLRELVAAVLMKGPEVLATAMKMALYAGYKYNAEQAEKKDVPDAFKNAFKDDEPPKEAA